MRTALRKMGNSAGMIVPKVILSELGSRIGEEFDIRAEDGRIVASPVRDPTRAGWAEASAALAEAGEDALAWPEFANEDDADLAW